MDDPAARLIDWFEREQRRLPWRGPFPRDPYRVLVSEVMLQQTQVERVVEPYERFLARFPTVAALAAADREEVVRAFSGLGYYGRARRLHAAARAVVAAGGWPGSRSALARLPGVGAYTSAALAAFCFDGADPPVDGNVARVAARVEALTLAMGSSSLQRAAESFARELYEGGRTPLLWEALMELGARVCTPARPDCPACPLFSGCAGRRLGPSAYPAARPQRPREDVGWVALWLERSDNRVLLRRVDAGGILAGLWLPPFAVLARGEDPRRIATRLAESAGHSGPLRAAGPVAHGITHRRITVLTFVGPAGDDRVAERREHDLWVDPRHPSVPVPTLLGKLAHACAVAASAVDAAAPED